MKRFIAIFACVFLTACGGGSMSCVGPLPSCNGGSQLQSIIVSSPAASFGVGATMQFTATGKYRNGSTANITSASLWSTDAPQIAVIGETGVAFGVQPGAVNIAAGAGPITGFKLVTIGP